MQLPTLDAKFKQTFTDKSFTLSLHVAMFKRRIFASS